MKKLLIIMFFCLAVTLLAGAPALAEDFKPLPHASGTADLPAVISAIDIEGEQNISEKALLEVIFSLVGNTLLESKVRDDMKAIYALGYFSDISVTMEAYNNGTKITFIVKENPRVRGISIEGNTVFSSAEIISVLKTKKGSVLNYKFLQEDIDTINEKYQSDGYMLARVVDSEIDPKTDILKFKIIEGIVEAITLDGNTTTQDYVIIRELNTKPGSVLNEKILAKDLRRVFNLGFFSQVSPVFEPGSTRDKVIIVLKIEETRSSSVNFGGGYGEREGWFGFADLSLNNLAGTAQGVMVRGQFGQEVSTYQLKYTNPWFFPSKLGPRTGFTAKKWYTIGRDIFILDQDGIYNGFEMSFSKPFKENFSTTVTFGNESVTPYKEATFEAYVQNTLGLSFSYDTRDFWMNPTSGVYYVLSLKEGWKDTSGIPTNFFKLGWNVNHFYSLRKNHILAFHLGAGIGFGDIPVGEEYWAGGANTVRGYWPTNARHGTRKLIANIEYRLNFNDMFQGVMFFDWGNAWSKGAPVPSNFLTGWGPGVRLTTPLGPIRLDYGVPAGATFGEGYIHFSIGQAF